MDHALPLAVGSVEKSETLTSGLHGPARWLIEALPGVGLLNRLYVESQRRPEARFADRALATLGVEWHAEGYVERLPGRGPLIVVANHPTGALDGLVLLALVSRRRADVRLMANDWLASIRPMADDFVGVRTFGDGRSANVRPLRDAVRWLRDGGALIVFPAGAVSHLHACAGLVADPEWHDGAARLAKLTDATVLPCHLSGRNSALFQAAGLFSPWLRTALLPRELLRQRGARVEVRVGRPFEPSHVAGLDANDMTRRLREIAYGEGDAQARVAFRPAPALQSESLADAVAAMEGSRVLAETAEYSVFWFKAHEAPRLLDAIGRGREIAFRAAGEGTGEDIDLDRFDAQYVHLCLWDRQSQQVAGGYRMRVVEENDKASDLYTHSLFDFDRRLVKSLAPALELGRAFVMPTHQKRHQPLMLLWSGIARFVAAHPHIRHLFGAVSIGASYSTAARAFMTAYLRRHALDRLRAPLVTPRHPLADSAWTDEALDAPLDPQALSASVQARDEGGKGLPVLLRQYLKLQARVLDFSVDPAFSHVLDALVAIDLPAAPRALLRRYMGPDAADAYLAHHLRQESMQRLAS
jgi:putative hemolysin